MNRSIVAGIAAVAVAAALVPSALGGGSGGPPDPWQQHLTARTADQSVGADDRSGPKGIGVTGGAPDPWFVHLIARSAAPEAVAAAPAATSISEDAFDWAAAGIGLGVGIGLMLIAGATVSGFRRRSLRRLAHS